jgi:hypothetical protein
MIRSDLPDHPTPVTLKSFFGPIVRMENRKLLGKFSSPADKIRSTLKLRAHQRFMRRVSLMILNSYQICINGFEIHIQFVIIFLLTIQN